MSADTPTDEIARLVERLGALVSDSHRSRYDEFASDAAVVDAEAAILRASQILAALVLAEADRAIRSRLTAAAVSAVEEAERAATAAAAAIARHSR